MIEYLNNISDKNALTIIDELKKLVGAVDYDGNYSTQVFFKLENGHRLRFGLNDTFLIIVNPPQASISIPSEIHLSRDQNLI